MWLLIVAVSFLIAAASFVGVVVGMLSWDYHKCEHRQADKDWSDNFSFRTMRQSTELRAWRYVAWPFWFILGGIAWAAYWLTSFRFIPDITFKDRYKDCND